MNVKIISQVVALAAGASMETRMSTFYFRALASTQAACALSSDAVRTTGMERLLTTAAVVDLCHHVIVEHARLVQVLAASMPIEIFSPSVGRTTVLTVFSTSGGVSHNLRMVSTAVEKLLRLRILKYLLVMVVPAHVPASSLIFLRGAIKFCMFVR